MSDTPSWRRGKANDPETERIMNVLDAYGAGDYREMTMSDTHDEALPDYSAAMRSIGEACDHDAAPNDDDYARGYGDGYVQGRDEARTIQREMAAARRRRRVSDEELVERVAEAIATAIKLNPKAGIEWWPVVEKQARAAIEAVREHDAPTGGTPEDVPDTSHYQTYDPDAEDVFPKGQVDELIASHRRLCDAIRAFIDPIQDLSGDELSKRIGIPVHPLVLTATWALEHHMSAAETFPGWSTLAEMNGLSPGDLDPPKGEDA